MLGEGGFSLTVKGTGFAPSARFNPLALLGSSGRGGVAKPSSLSPGFGDLGFGFFELFFGVAGWTSSD